MFACHMASGMILTCFVTILQDLFCDLNVIVYDLISVVIKGVYNLLITLLLCCGRFMMGLVC